MKNINLPPHITLIMGILLILVSTFFREAYVVAHGVILFIGIILTTIGVAGLILELFGKSVRVILESPVSDLKLSKDIAYLLSFTILPVFILNLENLNLIALPITFLFLLTLAFNGGVGGTKLRDRFPFYLATISFILFFVSFLLKG